MGGARLWLSIATIVCSVSCRDPGPIPPVPPPPVTSIFGPSDVLGCYQHVPSRSVMRHAPPWEPPAKFQLVIEARMTVPREGRVVTLRGIRQARSYRADGYWRVTGDGMMEVTWTNGFEGVRLRLQHGTVDDMWRGWTEPYSDDGVAAAGARVSVRRVDAAACRFGPKKTGPLP